MTVLAEEHRPRRLLVLCSQVELQLLDAAEVADFEVPDVDIANRRRDLGHAPQPTHVRRERIAEALSQTPEVVADGARPLRRLAEYLPQRPRECLGGVAKRLRRSPSRLLDRPCACAH